MPRAAFLGCALILLALFILATVAQPGFENLVANNVQVTLNDSDSDYQTVCHGISRRISPASQVFYPGAVLAFFHVGTIAQLLR